MAAFNKYLNCLDEKLQEKNIITGYLEKAEKATGVKRRYIVLGAGGIWALYMVLGCCAELICNAIGFGYPAYASLAALETRGKEDDVKWLTYWVTFAAFSIVEFFSHIILSFIPFYWLLKCLFLIYCFAPLEKNGSHLIYNSVLRPFFLKNKDAINDAINKATGAAAQAAGRIASSSKAD